VNYEKIIAEKDAQIASLTHQLEQLKTLIFGQKRERFKSNIPDEQLNLFVLPEAEQVEDPAIEKITYERKKSTNHPGRSPLPDHLPVEEHIIEPQVDTEGMVKIGEEITETLDYTPASLVIKRTIRPKYVDSKNERIHIGPLPERPLSKGIAEAGLLAHILVSKFVDHLPYYRQIQRFKRDFRWEVSQSTINNWMAACCTLLKPLYQDMKKKILQSHYIQADESPIRVLDQDKPGTTHQGYQWVYHAPEEGIVVFHYRKGRGMHGPKELLMNYSGYLQCDGYKVYDKIGKRKEITLVGCLVHARRKFFEAKESDAKRSDYALDVFQQIYRANKQINLMSPNEGQKQQMRIETIKPLMEELLDWVQEESIEVLPKSRIGKAMVYYQNQWPKLQNILFDPKLELDNNLIENKIRPLALGRKNYLFAGSHNGAEWAAMIYSFFATCKIHQVNPWDWLKDVLQKLTETNIQELDQLMPQNWRPLEDM
jgi:transposase